MSRLAPGRDPGTLFDRVDIEAEQPVPDGAGGYLPKPEWLPVPGLSDLPAEILDIDGFERIQAMQTQPGVTTRVTVRHVDGIASAMRVVVTSQPGRVLYLTEPPITVGRRQWLTLLCREAA
jgi:SPP1 family predicted phage head-tail adaptor